MRMRENCLKGASILASTFVLAGCQQITTGNTISADQGQCVQSEGVVKLSPKQTIKVGGDIEYEKGVTSDYLGITNIGKNTLRLYRETSDEGTLTFNRTTLTPKEDDGFTASEVSIDLAVDNPPSVSENSFTYSENKSSTSFTPKLVENEVIALRFITSCEQ